MSEQPPLASPSGPEPSPYDSPAYGDVGGTAAPGAEPTRMVPPAPSPSFDKPTPEGPSYDSAPPPPPAGGGYGGYGAPGAGAPGGAGWAPYPVNPPGGAPYQVNQQYVAFGAPTHQLATTSLVLGIVGIAGILLTPFLLITFVAAACSPFAIWLGVRSRREIRANPRQYGGEGVATAGLITGIIGVVLGVIGLLLILAFFVFLAAVFSTGA